ncbi:hypothetical protein OG21DRAFT_1501965 [Imleria badia]|nr:hypothetical protein OG21DRAFT_1501965 [Imleria badia]
MSSTRSPSAPARRSLPPVLRRPACPPLASRSAPPKDLPNAPGSSLRKAIALTTPERKPLFLAICLLFVSSSVPMTVPLTVGKISSPPTILLSMKNGLYELQNEPDDV